MAQSSRARRGSRRRRETTEDAAIRVLVANLRDELEGLASEPDPLGAELFASGVLDLWRPGPFDKPAEAERLARTLLDRLARQPDADLLAGLVAIAAVAEPPFDRLARDAAVRVRAAGVPEPIWARSIGRPTLVDTWISTDELDDQSHLLAAFAYDRRPPHAFNLILDENFGGLIRDAFIADDPERVRREWVAASGLPIRALSEQALADLLARGIEMFEGYLDPPTTDDAASLIPLLRARLRLLPEPRPIDVPEVSEEDRQALVADFGLAPEAAALGTVGDGPASDLASWFIDFACDYGAGDPLRWSPIAVEILLLDWLPRKAIVEPADVDALPVVLCAYVTFSARRKGLAESIVSETLELIDKLAPEFREAMADPALAGPAKEIALGLRAAGVDLTDSDAVQRWIDARNASLAGD